MKTVGRKLWIVVGLSLLLGQGVMRSAEPMDTGFTYQGRLVDANQPANGFYDFQFRLFDGSTDGNQVGRTNSFFDVFVDDGYFTEVLDFDVEQADRSFNGDARWLEIAVRPSDGPPAAGSIRTLSLETSASAPYTILLPRRQVAPVPYALYALDGGGAGLMTSGSGTDNYIPRWRGTDTLENSVIYQADTSRNVGIGTTSPLAPLQVGDTAVKTSASTRLLVGSTSPTNYIEINNSTSGSSIIMGMEDNSTANIATDKDLWLSPGWSSSGHKPRMVLKSNGNVGIGTKDPSALLHLAGGSSGVVNLLNLGGTVPAEAKLRVSYSTTQSYYRFKDITLNYDESLLRKDNSSLSALGLSMGVGDTLSAGGFNFKYMPPANSTWASALYIDHSLGKVGIGTTNPLAQLHLNTGTFLLGTSGSKQLRMRDTEGSFVDIESVGVPLYINRTTTRPIYLMGPAVGIGTTTPGSYRLYVSGTACASKWDLTSDLRFKQNIKTIDSPIDKVMNVKGVSFEWKTADYKDKGFPEGRHYGVIAQQVEQVLPEVVTEGPDGEKAVAYTELVPVLIEAIKQQQKEIVSLKEALAQSESLNQRLDLMERRMEKLERDSSRVTW